MHSVQVDFADYIDVFDFDTGDEIYQIGIRDYTPAIPGQLFGPPENCYPGEPSEMDYDIILCGWTVDDLTYEQQTKVEAMIDELFGG